MSARMFGRLLALTLLPGMMAAGGCAAGTMSTGPQPFPGLPGRHASAAATGAPLVVSALLEEALALRGTAYRLGGDSPATGFDCSGFVHYVFAQIGVEMPRTVADQYGVGTIVPLPRVSPGDLVFFTTTAPGPTHVGIAVDGQRFVHAPATGGVVRVESLRSSYWSPRIIGVRRIDTRAR